jgi:hypothetical protein
MQEKVNDKDEYGDYYYEGEYADDDNDEPIDVFKIFQ